MNIQTDNILNKKYHYFYKITNRINGMFYYGIHSTDDLNDGYMGSGTRLKAAIKKYGLINFDKEIIKYFESLKELSDYEKKIVNSDLLKDKNCYNLVEGGYFLDNESILKRKQTYNNIKHQQGKNNSQYKTCWINKNGLSIKIPKNEFANYETDGWIKGRIIQNSSKIIKANKTRKFVWVYKDGIAIQIDKNKLQQYLDDNWIRGRSEKKSKNKINKLQKIKVIDKLGNLLTVDKDDPRYLSGELKYFTRGKIFVRDVNNNKFYVDTNDSRYLSGELIKVSSFKGKILIKDSNGKYYSVGKDDPRLSDQNYTMSTKGLKYTDEQKLKIKTAKTKYKMTWVNNGIIHKYIKLNELNEFLQNNCDWVAGRIKKSK